MPQSHGSEPSRIGPISGLEMGLGFRSERQHGHANQEHRTHGDAGVAHPVRSMEDDQRRHAMRQPSAASRCPAPLFGYVCKFVPVAKHCRLVGPATPQQAC